MLLGTVVIVLVNAKYYVPQKIRWPIEGIVGFLVLAYIVYRFTSSRKQA